jgi:hypothetical protein
LYSPVRTPKSFRQPCFLVAEDMAIQHSPLSRSWPGGDRKVHCFSLTPSHIANAMRESVISERVCRCVKMLLAQRKYKCANGRKRKEKSGLISIHDDGGWREGRTHIQDFRYCPWRDRKHGQIARGKSHRGRSCGHAYISDVHRARCTYCFG